MRLEIMTKDSELRRLRDKVDNYEREIQEVRMNLLKLSVFEKNVFIHVALKMTQNYVLILYCWHYLS